MRADSVFGPIVDAHCHASERWFEPVETLLSVMDQNEVEHAVLIQILNEWDNAYLLSCLHNYPGRFAAVVGVDARAADVVETLGSLAKSGATGVRLRATDRTNGSDPLLVWRAAEDLQLAVSCAGSISDFIDPRFIEVIESVPSLAIVLEHLAAMRRPRVGESGAQTEDPIARLASYVNVALKVPGIGELSDRALPVSDVIFTDPAPDVLRHAYVSFGPDRLMWGSDFPPVASREGYRNSLRHAFAAVTTISPLHLDQVFGGNARRIFFRGA
jgi:L-fuconolactonase